MKRMSPTFVAAATVILVSTMILMTMMMYAPGDYFGARADVISKEHGLKFWIPAAFFGPLGLGAYLGFAILLAWGVIVFFRESVGELAIRAVSLVGVVVSGAALADILGSSHLGGDVGGAIGNVLQANFGTTFGVILIGAVFGISFLLATDFGFVSYYREARSALAVAEPPEEEAPAVADDAEPTATMDLLARIEAAAQEAEDEEADQAREQAEVAIATATLPVEEETGERPHHRLDLRPPIEEEKLDEDLLTDDAGEEEAPAAVAEEAVAEPAVEAETEEAPGDGAEAAIAAEEEPEAGAGPGPEAEAPAEPEEAAFPETMADIDAREEESSAPAEVPEPEPAVDALAAVFDALVGPRPEPTPEEVEAHRVLLDDEIEIVHERPEEEAPEPEAEAEPEAPAPREEEPVLQERMVLLDDVITIGESEAEPEDEVAPEAEAEPAEAAEPEVILVDEELPAAEEPPADAEPEREEMLPFMKEEERTGEEIPVLTDVREEEPKKRGIRSLFRRKKPEPAAPAAAAEDMLVDQAARLVIERGRASVVLLQRRLDIGYTRASRLVDVLEREGLVGPLLESGSREVLMTQETWEALRE